MTISRAEQQEHLDTFYFAHGPCCAGCDWWRSLNVSAGLCTRTAPVAGPRRTQMLDIEGTSLDLGAGHVMTPREHVCGEFKDEFYWPCLSPHYRRRVGDPNAPSRGDDPAARALPTNPEGGV